MFISGLLVCVGLPTVIGVVIANNYGLRDFAGAIGIIVFFISLMIALIYLTVLT